MPPDLLDALLRRPHPYREFVNILYYSEYCRLCFQEIERRSEARPELMTQLQYMDANPRKLARQLAVRYLRRMSFEMRANEAEHFTTAKAPRKMRCTGLGGRFRMRLVDPSCHFLYVFQIATESLRHRDH